ncbi:MAG: class I SAM-dependent methyltransferase [candidate division Zixibacteria bacterium]|nr:class I SAM-dependent methyltransferase [candidate division Zixibacteria bacterium]
MDILKEKLRSAHGGSVLDIATGGGSLLAYLKECFDDTALLVGIDNSPERLKQAGETVKVDGVCFLTMDAANLAFKSDSFDTVGIANSLHHMRDLPTTLREMKRVLKPGGLFVVSEMFRDGQTQAQRCHVDLHHWWAEIDRLAGISHNETYTKGEIAGFVSDLELTDIFTHEDPHDDLNPVDDKQMKELIGVIDDYPNKINGHSEYDRMTAKGEQLKKRITDIGFSWATHLMLIGRKQQ